MEFLHSFSVKLLEFIKYLTHISTTPIIDPIVIPLSNVPLVNLNNITIEFSLLGLFGTAFIGGVIVYGIVKFFTDIIF